MLTGPTLIEEVAAAIREVGNAEVVPRFRSLAAGDITEKGPGDLVTIADQECERVLSERLRVFRDIPVVGEEATAADPSLLDLVATAPAVWVTDPIDGTSNFVAGNPNFVVMVSLVENGTTMAAWVWHPETDTMLTAERGNGLLRNGEPAPTPTRSDRARGILKRKFMDEVGPGPPRFLSYGNRRGCRRLRQCWHRIRRTHRRSDRLPDVLAHVAVGPFARRFIGRRSWLARRSP